MSEAAFVVPGRPVPQPRMTRAGVHVKGHPKRAAMDRYLQFKNDVGWAAKAVIQEPFSGPVIVDISVYIKDRMTRRWDIDNVAKAVLDGCNKVAFHDDKQVTGLGIRILSAARHPALDNDPTERVEVWVSQCT